MSITEYQPTDEPSLTGVDTPVVRSGLDEVDLDGELIGADLAGADLSGADLSGRDLTGADLTDADLSQARLIGTCLRNAVLVEATLEKAQLLGADLTDADLSHAEAPSAVLGNANLTNAVLFDANLCHATFAHADLTGADVRTANLEDARLREATLAHTDLSRARMRGADLTGANVQHALLHDSDLSETRLKGLTGYATADWIGVEILDANFAGAYMARRAIMDQNYLYEFRHKSRLHAAIFHLWRITSDCGRSFLRWGLWTALIALAFALGYTFVEVDYGAHETALSPLYYSVVTMTTLGYGDVLPASSTAQWMAMAQVVIGYVMLGGVLSIFATKMGRRAE